MSILMFCWRCGVDVPMLTEAEWAELEPLLLNAIDDIKDYRVRHGCSLEDTPIEQLYADVVAKYELLTGFRSGNGAEIWNHRAAVYGPPCVECGKPLRTPRASFCAACGSSEVS